MTSFFVIVILSLTLLEVKNIYMNIIKWLLETFSPYHNEIWSRKQARDEFAKKQLKVNYKK